MINSAIFCVCFLELCSGGLVNMNAGLLSISSPYFVFFSLSKLSAYARTSV